MKLNNSWKFGRSFMRWDMKMTCTVCIKRKTKKDEYKKGEEKNSPVKNIKIRALTHTHNKPCILIKYLQVTEKKCDTIFYVYRETRNKPPTTVKCWTTTTKIIIASTYQQQHWALFSTQYTVPENKIKSTQRKNK